MIIFIYESLHWFAYRTNFCQYINDYWGKLSWPHLSTRYDFMSFLGDLYELSECVFSNVLLEKMIYRKIHICNLYIHHELYEDVSPNIAM